METRPDSPDRRPDRAVPRRMPTAALGESRRASAARNRFAGPRRSRYPWQHAVANGNRTSTTTSSLSGATRIEMPRQRRRRPGRARPHHLLAPSPCVRHAQRHGTTLLQRMGDDTTPEEPVARTDGRRRGPAGPAPAHLPPPGAPLRAAGESPRHPPRLRRQRGRSSTRSCASARPRRRGTPQEPPRGTGSDAGGAPELIPPRS